MLLRIISSKQGARRLRAKFDHSVSGVVYSGDECGGYITHQFANVHIISTCRQDVKPARLERIGRQTSHEYGTME